MSYPDSEDDIEVSRQERLGDLRASGRGGEAGLQDAIRIAAHLMKSVDDGLAGNPAVVSDPDLYRLAYRAFESLYELHRAMGGAHAPASGQAEGASSPAARPPKSRR